MAEDESAVFWMKVKLWSAMFGIVAGFAAFFAFTLAIENYHAGLWALLSAILATFAFQGHLLYKNLRMERWHTPHSLTALRNLAILTFLGSASASIYYLYTAVDEQQPIHPYKDSWLLAAGWSFMSVKWSIALGWSSHQYKTYLEREYSLL